MNGTRIFSIICMIVGFLVLTACTISFGPARSEAEVKFSATDLSLEQDECTYLFWEVEGGKNVRLNNEAVVAVGTRQVCPDATTSYILNYEHDDSPQFSQLTIMVNDQNGSSSQEQGEVSLDFWADKTTITKGECTTLHWRASGGSVWLYETKYPAESEMEVCPEETREYYAEVGNQLVIKTIVITVHAGSPPSSDNSQQQPAQQQPATQQPAAAPQPEAPLTFTCDPSCLIPGVPITINLSRSANVDVYLGGQVVAKKTSSDGKTLTVTVPSSFDMNNQYVELKGEGTYAKTDLKFGTCNLSFGVFDIYWETDLAVTDLYPTNQPIGQIFARITNRGPGAINRTQIDLVCGAQLEVRPGGVVQSADPINKQNVYLLTIAHNETQIFDTGIVSDTDSFFYNVTCLVRPHEETYYGFHQEWGWKYQIGESNWPNNTYSERMP